MAGIAVNCLPILTTPNLYFLLGRGAVIPSPPCFFLSLLCVQLWERHSPSPYYLLRRERWPTSQLASTLHADEWRLQLLRAAQPRRLPSKADTPCPGPRNPYWAQTLQHTSASPYFHVPHTLCVPRRWLTIRYSTSRWHSNIQPLTRHCRARHSTVWACWWWSMVCSVGMPPTIGHPQ